MGFKTKAGGPRKMAPMGIRFSEEEWDKLDKLSAQLRIQKSDVIRHLIMVAEPSNLPLVVFTPNRAEG